MIDESFFPTSTAPQTGVFVAGSKAMPLLGSSGLISAPRNRGNTLELSRKMMLKIFLIGSCDRLCLI
jgi:hypothetical protein